MDRPAGHRSIERRVLQSAWPCAGNYGFLHTVPGNGQCADATATVTVTIVSQLDAGSNGTVQVCSSNTTFNLFNGLGGSPDPGGV